MNKQNPPYLTAKEIKQQMYDLGYALFREAGYPSYFIKRNYKGKELVSVDIMTWKEARAFLAGGQ